MLRSIPEIKKTRIITYHLQQYTINTKSTLKNGSPRNIYLADMSDKDGKTLFLNFTEV